MSEATDAPRPAAIEDGAVPRGRHVTHRAGQRLAWSGAVLFFGSLAAANAVRVAPAGASGNFEYLETVVFGAAFFVVWVAAFGRLWPAVLTAAVLFAWWWPAELYLRHEYATPLAPQFVGMALESDGRELGEFLATFWREVSVGLALLLAVSVPALVLTRRYPARWSDRSRWWCLAVLSTAAVVMYALFELQEPSWLKPTEDPFRVEPLAFWSDKWRSVFPMTLPLALVRFQEDKARLDHMRQQVAGFRFGVLKAQAPLDAVVLVIGESARADRFSLAGYARETNPLLAKRANLIVYSDVVTPSVATRYAVPFMMSRRPILAPDGKPTPHPEPSLIAAFNEAGYRSTWLSNQSSSGFWDTTTAFYARDAQTVRYMNPATAEHRGNHDEALVDAFTAQLRESGPQLIVLHTMGSHFNYANRYPGRFERFRPSLTASGPPARAASEHVLRTSNSYDNTILYTDYVLDRLIGELDRGSRRVVLAYVSDHGEDLDEAACPRRGITRHGRWSYRVPALFWASDALTRERPSMLAQLRAGAHEPLMTDAILPILLDLAGVKVPGIDKWSRDRPLSASQGTRARMVIGKGGSWVDFDAAERRNPCSIQD